VACRSKKIITGAGRHVQDLRQEKDHLAARAAATRFDEAKVARGDLGLYSQGKLTHPATRSPLSE
jgi:hypothetical protein